MKNLYSNKILHKHLRTYVYVCVYDNGKACICACRIFYIIKMSQRLIFRVKIGFFHGKFTWKMKIFYAWLWFCRIKIERVKILLKNHPRLMIFLYIVRRHYTIQHFIVLNEQNFFFTFFTKTNIFLGKIIIGIKLYIPLVIIALGISI